MAQAAPIIIGAASLITAVGSAVNTYKEQQRARDDAKDAEREAKLLAEKNAANIEAETAEQTRRAEEDKKRKAATLRARLAASGIRGVSPESYINAFLSERDREIEWIKSSGASRADIARSSYSGTSVPGGSAAQLASGVTSAFSSGYSWYERYVN